MSKTSRLLGLDVGSARIGVAIGDSNVRIAIAQEHIVVDGNEVSAVKALVDNNGITDIVVGYPRNQSGDPTKQTEAVEEFCQRLASIAAELHFQDESLTSVIAEQRLAQRRSAYTKGDIDSEAATIILQDYMEQHL